MKFVDDDDDDDDDDNSTLQRVEGNSRELIMIRQ